MVVCEERIHAVFAMSEGRGAKGIRPHNSVNAASILFAIVIEELDELTSAVADGGRLMALASAALNRTIMLRLELGAKGYDSFLLNQVRRVVEAHRLELARDIHDHMGNGVSLAMRHVEIVGIRAGDDPAVRAAMTALQETMRQMSEMTSELRRHSGEGSLRTALVAFTESMQLQEPKISVQVNGFQAWASEEVLNQVFLIVREALRNSIAHARAKTVDVRIDIAPHDISAVVNDDGIGLVEKTIPRRNGLNSMSERAELLMGRLTICPQLPRGTRVSFWAPIGAERDLAEAASM
ncbi:sensor histidine kinase [Nocardia tengchongensis]|uniref:sensor histidine kinase n=1 Tax=Nocardia tengchongensis TaxID=2055889 RepID=UPI00367B966F